MQFKKKNLFKEVIIDMATDWISIEIEIDAHIFAETTRIIVSIRTCTTKRLEYGRWTQQHILDTAINHLTVYTQAILKESLT